MDLNYNDISKLKDIINVPDEKDYDYEITGTTLNPAFVNHNNNKKEVAEPNAKVIPTINTRNITTNASKTDNIIWDTEELLNKKDNNDDRKGDREEPIFEIMHRQKIGAEDVYLGLSGMDPSSNKCQEIIMKIQLPNTNIKEVSLDLKQNKIILETPKYFLDHYLPYNIKEKESTAKWIKDKNILEVIVY